MSKIVQITDQNFEEEVLNSDIPTEVDFWAPWCVPCRMVIPIYEKLSEEYDGRFKFCMINVDENPKTATKYQIMSIPMQKYFVDGENVDEILGAVPEDTIRTMVESILKKYPTSEKGRLEMILTAWVEHNKKYREKFDKWAEKSNDLRGNSSYESILSARQEMEKANERLSQALIESQKGE